MTQYWLVKSEPDCFSIDDLCNAPDCISPWDGVRNYQARNYMRYDMRVGDQVLFYHSNCKPPGIVGLAEVVSEPYPDYTAFDPESEHPDPQSTPENPRWFMVDIQFRKKFNRMFSLDELKRYPELQSMLILRKGNRLSVTPVSKEEYEFIMGLAT